jgi:hypothetical protein
MAKQSTPPEWNKISDNALAGSHPSKLDDQKLNAHQVDIRDDHRESERQARASYKGTK